MSIKTIAFDIDGVLADFIGGAMQYAEKLLDRQLPKVTTVTHQDWDIYPGMGADDVALLWDAIKVEPGFWGGLDSLATVEEWGLIRRLQAEGHRVYFATNRNFPGTFLATYSWLDKQCNPCSNQSRLPVNAVVTHRKGEFCKTVGADFYLDDKSENTDCVSWFTDGATKAFVLERPYNSGVKAPHSHKVGVVKTIKEFIEKTGCIEVL